MKLFKNHNKRVEKINEYVSKNKVFVAIAAIATVALLWNMLFRQPEPAPPDGGESAVTAVDGQEIVAENGENTNENNPEETAALETGWRFYFIDVVILAVGSGFCLIMILRERKKAKEKL